MTEFEKFQKIPRLSRACVVTEKIDGTNGTIHIEELEGYSHEEDESVWCGDGYAIWAGSRSKWITPASDNHGFAAWVRDHGRELLALGPGTHRGEWWGQEIQRNYGLKEKRFSLFNTSKWSDPTVRPTCCLVVPIIAEGIFSTKIVDESLLLLRECGSVAVRGWMKPEGVVVFHVAGNLLFKKTLENDEEPKGQRRN